MLADLVDGQAGHFALNIPERHVDGGNCGHRHRAATPIRGAIQKLPGVSDPAGILAQQRSDVLAEVPGLARPAARLTARYVLP
jgi:hypothetical protein